MKKYLVAVIALFLFTIKTTSDNAIAQINHATPCYANWEVRGGTHSQVAGKFGYTNCQLGAVMKRLQFGKDGNLAIWNGKGSIHNSGWLEIDMRHAKMIWSSKTANKGAQLIIWQNGALTIARGQTCLWRSNALLSNVGDAKFVFDYHGFLTIYHGRKIVFSTKRGDTGSNDFCERRCPVC